MSALSWTEIAGQFVVVHNAQLNNALALCVDELACDVVQMDLRAVAQQADALTILAQRGQFPNYFGGNLDALYDVMSERIDVSATTSTTNQLWLIRSLPAQEKMLYPIFDTLRDALSQSSGITLTLLWWINE